MVAQTLAICAHRWHPPVRCALRVYESRKTRLILLIAGAGFIELSYLLQSLFGAKIYFAFGFLALTTVIVALTTATTTILMCYFHLCAEDYR